MNIEQNRRNNGKDTAEKSIFISWSGPYSKECAKSLKVILENSIFPETGLRCFVSDEDIKAGHDWWSKTNHELLSCQLGIICVTKDTVKSPWMFYEAGGMSAHDIPTIPLLIGCTVKHLANSPLQKRQCVSLEDKQKFIKMISEINEYFGRLLPPKFVGRIAESAYNELMDAISPTLDTLNSLVLIDEKSIYPQHITGARYHTIYLSVPMASISDNQYEEMHRFVFDLQQVLKEIGFSEIRSSALVIDGRAEFDGKTKAMRDNFSTLKEVDSILVVYPWKSPSSCLVDIGYGIALCKKMVIFFREGLPYILEEAGGYIRHVRTYSFNEFQDIIEVIKSNGITIFDGEDE